jgi:predicted TIM-barrel fold metal-dependent hydrolase
MAATGIGTLLVDTGLGPADLCGPDQVAALSGGRAFEVVRLERLAEQVVASGSDDVAGEILQRLTAARDAGAVGAKSIAAYRVGLALAATKPSDDDLRRALPGVDPTRIADPVVSAWLAHTALETGLPLQFHVGYGDKDVDLLTCDPLRLTAFLRATEERGVPVLLLHCYPFHRHASYLAQVFGHVFMDLGLATHNSGALATSLLRETLELVPFGKLLFSTDAYALAELYLLGAVLFRSAMTGVLGELVAASEMTETDAGHVAGLVARENARRVYAL